MASGDSIAASILAMAKEYLGQPYQGGGAAPGGWDCSGLVQYVYAKAGISLARTTFDQVNQGQAIDASQAAPGDLVFFNETGADAPGPGGSVWGHVGIYLGNGMMLNAENPQAGVTISNVSGFSPVGQYQFRRVISNYAGTGDTGMADAGTSAALLAAQTGTTANTNDSWDDSSIAASLGLSANLFDSDPSLQGLLADAVKNGWTPDSAVGQAKFTAALQNTSWYQTHTDQQRKWIALGKADPAEAGQQFISSLGTVMHTAAAMGIGLTKNQEWVLASQNAQFGWTDDELKYGIAANFKTNNTGTYGGQAGQVADDVFAKAQSYGQTVSAAQVGQTVANVLQGKSTAEDYTNQMKTNAMNMFPGFKDQIQAGATVKDIAAPYLSVYSNVLEQPGDNVDLAKDPVIKKALNYTPPPTTVSSVASGSASQATPPQPGGMPLWQFEQSLKDDPRWLATDNAQKSLTDASTKVLEDMGLAAQGG